MMSSSSSKKDTSMVLLQVYLKYQITEDDVNKGKRRPPGLPTEAGTTGISTTSLSTNIVGTQQHSITTRIVTIFKSPPSIIGVNKVFQWDDVQGLNTSNMFSFKYQLFLNDIYNWGNLDLLSYSMESNDILGDYQLPY